MSKKGYWMAMIDVRDAEIYQRHIEANAKALRAGPHANPERPTRNRHVVVEFSSYENARACYQSPEYQEALNFRLAASTGHFAIVEGA